VRGVWRKISPLAVIVECVCGGERESHTGSNEIRLALGRNVFDSKRRERSSNTQRALDMHSVVEGKTALYLVWLVIAVAPAVLQ